MSFSLFIFSSCVRSIVILCSHVTSTHAHPLDVLPSDASKTVASPLSLRAESCGFEGNPDIYGPGIRIDCQTIAVWISKYFFLSEAHVLRDNVTVFSTALLSVAIVLAVHHSSTYAAEAFIVLLLLSWNLFSGVRSRSSYASTVLKNRAIRVGFTEWFDVAAFALHAWFWFWALDRKFLETPCGTKVFFFGEVRMDGWFKHIVQVKVVLALVDHVYDGAFRVIGLWSHGPVRGQKEVTNAVVEFEEWRKRQSGNDGVKEEVRERKPSVNQVETVPMSRARTEPAVQDSPKMEFKGRHSKTWEPRTAFAEDDVGQSDTALEHIDTAVEVEHVDLIRIRLFEEIYSSEQFLTACTAAGPASQIQVRHPRIYTFIQRLSVVPRPIKIEQYTQTKLKSSTAPPSYRTCLAAMARAFFTFRFPHRAGALVTHLLRAKMLDILNGPPQIYHALDYTFTPPESAPSPLALALASKYQLAQLPSLNKGHKKYQATVDILVHIFLMVQIELTILWNNITRLGGLGNVGQLVPFIIGVGGLGLILARGAETWFMRWKHEKSGIESGDNDDEDVKEAPKTPAERFFEVYTEWKKLYEMKAEQQSCSGREGGRLGI